MVVRVCPLGQPANQSNLCSPAGGLERALAPARSGRGQVQGSGTGAKGVPSGGPSEKEKRGVGPIRSQAALTVP